MHRPLLFSFSIIAALAGPVHAADWPTRPVTVIVPFGAGGNTDMMARLGAQHLTAKLGQTFVIENKPSAGGSLGTGQVATAAPDGYTLLFSASANINLTPQVQKLAFDPVKQLVPITNVGTGTQMVAISLSAASEYVSWSRQQLTDHFVTELPRLLPKAGAAKVIWSTVTREAAATFRGSPGSASLRAQAATRLPGVFLAGAWTDTGWPATMEGAVRSGNRAAAAVRQHLAASANREGAAA
jgi:hypothetical protein